MRLERLLAADARRLDLNGTVLVARNGRILVRKGYGFADAARRVPNGPRTRFRITSLTSRFSLVAIEQLGRRGRLDLDASICAHIAACPATWQAITPQLVLEGRSGLPLLPAGTPQRSLSGWIGWLRGQPLRFQPGTARDRGDARFLVGAHLVERASGRSWIDYLRMRIFVPAHMTDTVLDRPSLPRRARPYMRTRSRTLGLPASFRPLVVPDVLYGLASTVEISIGSSARSRTGRSSASRPTCAGSSSATGRTERPTAGTPPSLIIRPTG